MSTHTTVSSRTDSAKSALWQRPQVRRIQAGQAEAAAATGGDNYIYS